MRQSVHVGDQGWENDAWQQIQDYEQFWTPFDARFHFRPGVSSETWPAILEPAGSVTFDLSPVFDREGGFAADEARLTAEVLAAVVAITAPEVAWVALDWQHPSYWFWPHRQVIANEPWRVPPFPNGDYYALISQDLEQGTFGHPWEQTLCIFGGPLSEALVPSLASWLPVKRSS